MVPKRVYLIRDKIIDALIKVSGNKYTKEDFQFESKNKKRGIFHYRLALLSILNETDFKKLLKNDKAVVWGIPRNIPSRHSHVIYAEKVISGTSKAKNKNELKKAIEEIVSSAKSELHPDVFKEEEITDTNGKLFMYNLKEIMDAFSIDQYGETSSTARLDFLESQMKSRFERFVQNNFSNLTYMQRTGEMIPEEVLDDLFKSMNTPAEYINLVKSKIIKVKV